MSFPMPLSTRLMLQPSRREFSGRQLVLVPGNLAVIDRRRQHVNIGVSIDIDAPPAMVWKALTTASELPKWNSTVNTLEGEIALGSTVSLTPRVAPDQVFELLISKFDAPNTMVWEDGNAVFKGVRTYTLTETPGGGTRFAMVENLGGYAFGMIEGSLPDFAPEFEAYAKDLKTHVEAANAKQVSR